MTLFLIISVVQGSSMEEHGGASHGKKRGTTAIMTWFNVLCTMAGTGILQLPYTLQQGGWACILLVFLVAVMTSVFPKYVQCEFEIILSLETSALFESTVKWRMGIPRTLAWYAGLPPDATSV